MNPAANARPFVGRQRELAQLGQLASRARAGEPAVVLVSGDGGLGKTRLLAELAAIEEQADALVLVGGSPPVVGSNLPFAPIAQILRGLVKANDPALAAGAGVADELFALVPELGARRQAGADGPSLTTIAEQFLSLITRLAAGRQLVVVVIEDLEWTDASSLDLLGYLVRNLRDDRVLVAATFRNMTDLPAATSRLVTELGRAGAERLVLSPLAASDVAAHIADVGGSELRPELVQRIVRLADGNPFFAEELAAGAISGTGFPQTVEEMIRGTIERLPDEARHVLRLASVAGARVRAALLWHAAGMPEATCATAVRRLIADRILAPVDGPPGDILMVRQALVREAANEELLAPERARFHAAVARSLAAMPELGAGPAVETVIQTALHWRAAGDAMRAFPALVRAAQAAEQVYAFREADGLYQAALELADSVAGREKSETRTIGFQKPAPERDEMTSLRRQAAEAASLAGDPARAAALLEDVITRTPRAAESSLLAALGRFRLQAGANEAAVAAFGQAFEGAADPAQRARIRVGHARALLAAGRAPEGLEAALEARALADVAGKPNDRHQAMSVLAVAQARAGSREAALETLEQARRLTGWQDSASAIRPRPSRVLDLMATFGDAASLLRTAGRRDEALAAAQEGATAATRLGAAASATRLRVAAAQTLYEAGRWDEALAESAAVIEANPGDAAARLVRARILALRGRWEQAAADLAIAEAHLDVATDPATVAGFHAVLGELRYWRRQLVEASASVEAALAGHPAAEPESRVEWCELGVRIAAERLVQARALRATGEEQPFAELAAGYVTEIEMIGVRAGDRGTALLLSARAEQLRTGERADAPWSEAVDAWTKVDEPFRAAYAEFRLVESELAARSARSDAAARLRHAYSIALGLDAAPLTQEIRLLGQRARLDLEEAPAPVEAAGPAGPRDGANAHGLSTREIEVLVLIAGGRTNRQIGDELFITEKTAAHHVSNILAKLDVASRVEAAGVAHRMGLTTER